MRALIIEDEAPAREIVKTFMKSHADIELIGEFSDGFSGLKAIKELQPDLVFLDVQMPKITGFELLELLDERPQIVFTTAYDQYAIKAFEMNAVDYLLKPFSKERFNQALDKVRVNSIATKKADLKEDPIQHVLDTIDEKTENLFRVVVKKGSDIHMIPVEDILYFYSLDKATFLCTVDSFKGQKDGAVYLREEAYEGFLKGVIHIPKPYAVCVYPWDVKKAKEYLKEKDIKIASVIGFPNGNLYSTKHKIFETTIALENGADEIDMVLNYELFKSGKTQETLEDITNVANFVHKEGAIIKLILETSALNKKQIKSISELANNETDVDFIKTSTGFGKYGATVENLKIMRENFSRGIKISGGVNTKNVGQLLSAAVKRDDGYIDLNPMKIRIGESGLLKK